MTFHTQVVGANGQRQAMFIERVEGLAEVILANFELRPARRDDRLQRRRRSPPCRSRWHRARRRGSFVAVTSVAQAEVGSGPRLLDHADVVLDLCTPAGRARRARRARDAGRPGSTVAAVALANAIKVRTAELLLERGALPPVLTSAALVGAEESERLFDAAYAEHARRLAEV